MANNNHFNLTLDTLAPSGSISRTNQYINANENLTISIGDATFMKVWFDTNATGTKVIPDPENPGQTIPDPGYAGASWEAASTTKQTAFIDDGRYYYHLVLMDDVANESEVYNTQIIVFDTTAPVASSAYMEDPDSHSRVITNDTTGIIYGFSYSDLGPNGVGNGSGVITALVTGDDIDDIPLNLNPANTSYTGTLDFKSGTQDGVKTISIVVTDQAGNPSTAITTSITLDTVLDTPIIVLQDDQGTTLPAAINYDDIYVNVSSTDTGVVGYKIWEGTDADEPQNYTPYSSASFDVTIPFELSSGDGTKTIRAKIIDGAGTESAADPVSILVDTQDPAVSLSTDKAVISNVSGYNTAVLTMSGTDVGGSGVASYTLKCGNTTISSGITVPASFNLTSANSMIEGANTITLEVIDNAGNTNSASVTVTLDTTAPTVSISQLDTWYNDYFDASITYANDVTSIYMWANNTAEDTDASVATVVTPTGSPQTIAATSIYWRTVQSEYNYLHVKVVDAVGNVNYDHAQFGYDNVIPTKPTIAFSSTTYTSQSAAVTIQYNDATSGVVSMRVTGDITNPTANDQWEPALSSRNVTLTSGDGYKNVYVQVKDAAGNVSVLSDASTAELDTTTPSATLALFEANGTTPKPDISPVETLAVHITVENDDPIGGCEYLLYGDFTYNSQQAQGITEATAIWTPFVPDSGQVYMTVGNMYCTSGDGTKGIYVKIKDSAGNISQVVAQSFIYDTSAPTVRVDDVDYNRISKENVLRRNSSGPISDKYADQTVFTFTPSEYIQAFKVCAYDDQTAAAAGSYLDPAIPNTNGSINMSATGIDSNAQVTSTIKGADYELAIGGRSSSSGEFDGLHIVVVYVQDKAGTWSAAASFTVGN